MSERPIVNCGSFAYHYFGIIEKEIAVPTLTYRQLRKDFYPVYDIASADVIALIAPDKNKFVAVKHVMVVEPGKQTVAHRPGPNREVRVGFIEDEIQRYDKCDDLEAILLARR